MTEEQVGRQDDAQRQAALARRRELDAANIEAIRASRRRYNESHRAENVAREVARKRARRAAEQAERDAALAKEESARRGREYRKAYREKNRDRIRENHLGLQRAWIARKLAEDPEGFRAKRNAAGRAYREKNREQYNLQAREKARAKAGTRAAQQAEYRAAHREELARKRREAYAADPEKILEYNRRYKARERRRIAAGLPPRRVRHSTAAERKANQAASDDFFSGAGEPWRLRERRAAWMREQTTSAELIASMERQHDRLRAENGQPLPPPQVLRKAEREEQRRIAAAARAHERDLRERAEEARLDAIGARVNARLRRPPDPHPRDRASAARAHVPPGQISTNGISR